MKILCALNLFYVGSANLNCNYFFFINTFQVLGHQVQILDLSTLYQAGGRTLVSKTLLSMIFSFKPDLLFVVPHRNEVPRPLLYYITKFTRTLTLAWNSDDDRRWDNYSSKLISSFNYMITTYKEIYQRAKKEKITNLLLSQWACNPRFNKPLEVDKIWDCSFIGSAYGSRPEYIKHLKQKGFKVYFGGINWNQYIKNSRTNFSQSDLNLITNQSKISLVFTQGYQSKKKQIKARLFESTAAKVCTFVETTPNLEKYYVNGKEIVTFYNEDDLVKKLKYYLSHSKERDVIAESGYKRSIREHTYELRFNKIFQTINKSQKTNFLFKK